MSKLLENVSLQLYSLRELTAKQGLEPALRLAHDCGYAEVETGPVEDVSNAEFKALLDKYALRLTSLHVMHWDLEKDPEKYIAMAKELGTEYIVLPWNQIRTTEDALKYAETVNPLAKKCFDAGLKVAYHNHEHEFVRNHDTGEMIFDTLAAKLLPEISFEADIYWIAFAGVDLFDFIDRYWGRISLVHLKEISRGEPKTNPEIGLGSFDYNRVIHTLRRQGAEKFIVEQEQYTVEPAESVKIDKENLDKMEKKVFKCAVIGCGWISPAHIDAYRSCENAELVALCDTDEKWLEFAKEKYGVKYAYTDYHDLLANPEIEVVSVCVPNRFHAQVSIDALLAGKDVLCEKPMAISAAEAQKMIDAKNRSGRRLMIGQNQRFIPAAQIMRKMYQNGEFGEVYHIRTGWRRPMGWMPSPEDTRENGQITDRNWYNEKELHGGVLRDLGVHMLDLAMFITGFPKVTDAMAAGYRKFEPNISAEQKAKYAFTSEDLMTSIIKFDNGMSINMEVSFGSAVSGEALFTNIYGTRGGAERSFESLKLIKTKDCFSYTVEDADLTGTKPFNHCVFEFIDCLVNDTEVPVKPEESLRVLEVLDRLYESSGFNA